MNFNVEIDQEFRTLIPPLSKEEYAQLEANILTEGCRDALVVWVVQDDEEGYEALLLDGHNRYAICQRHGIPFNVAETYMPDRQAAINWIIDNQLGRRNLHPDQASYLRGKRYNGEKLTQGGTGANQHVQRDQNDLSATADRLASEYKVSAPTIKRDGQYAAAVDKLATVGIDPQAVIAHASKSDVIELAKELEKPEPVKPSLFEALAPKQETKPVVKQAINDIKAGAPVKEAIKETVKAVKQQAMVEPVMTSYITLDDWEKMAADERQRYRKGIATGKTFNRHVKPPDFVSDSAL